MLNGTTTNITKSLNKTRIRANFGVARTTMKVGKSRFANLSISSGSVLYEIRARFKNSSVSKFNISVLNSSQQFGPLPPPNREIYQYISINTTNYNTTNSSVDPYISNVTYNFQVNSSWIAQQNVPAQNITLMKYINTTASWIQLPTTLVGFNSSYYDYSAVSNSFSLYVVTYPAPTNVITTTANHIGILLTAGYPTYFYAGAVNAVVGARIKSFNWTVAANEVYNPTAVTNANEVVDIGYFNGIPAGSYNSFSSNVANVVIIGLAANVVETNGKIFTANTVQAVGAKSQLALVFNTLTANSFVVILSGIANTVNATTPSWFITNAPAGSCNIMQSNGIKSVWAGIITCNSLAAGSYNVITNSLTVNAIISTAAFVFPAYKLTLNDLPSQGDILTNSVTQITGNIINVIGTSSINAIAPPNANSVFSSWTTSNAANAVISGLTTQNTFLTVEGNVVLTSNFNSLTQFYETGLPAALAWNVVYNSIQVANTPAATGSNIVTFNVLWWGAYSFTVGNQVSGGTTYTPSNTGSTIGAGNAVLITFTAVSCFISLSNTVVNFGNIATGSNVPTANAVTDTNTGGTATATILIAGGTGGSTFWYQTGNWLGTSAANTIGVANTLYSASSQATYTGTAITNTITTTGITIPNSGSSTVYLGMGIPGGSPADAYTTNIVLENTC
jgi:PGF-pre-PGF domain-containing protein